MNKLMTYDEKETYLEGMRTDMSEVFKDIEARVSSETLTELQGIGQAFEQYAWKAGWATEKLYEEVTANGGRRTVEECCWYVSISSFNGLRSMNTVKRYLHNARFFSPKTVAKYDALPFSTFEYARSHEKGWKYILDRAMQEAKQWGKPLSVTQLRQKIDGGKIKVKPAITYDLTANFQISVDKAIEGLAEFSEEIKNNENNDALKSQIAGALSAAVHALQIVVPLTARMFPHLGIASARLVTILRQIETAVLQGQDADIPIP